MKHLAKLILLTLGVGVVVVILASLPRHASVSAAPAPTSSLVTLVATGTAIVTGPFYQYNSATGLLSSSPYAPPAGMSLVVTDIAMTVYGCPAGNIFDDQLYSSSSGGAAAGASVYRRIFAVDSTGTGNMVDHFTTGLVFTGPNIPVPAAGTDASCSDLEMRLQGVQVSGTPAVAALQ